MSFDEEEGTDELFSLMTSPSMGETGKEVPDEHQAAAIVTSARYALLVSGAGTGKTRVLGARMAHLIASKAAKPSQVHTLSAHIREKAGRPSHVDHMRKYIVWKGALPETGP